jgi:hypothetical protein
MGYFWTAHMGNLWKISKKIGNGINFILFQSRLKKK